jgi:hypothetical protein
MNQSQLLKRTIPWWKQYRDELARPIKKHSNLFNLLTVNAILHACNRLLPTVGPKENAEGRLGGSQLPMLSGAKISPQIKFSRKHKMVSRSCVSTVQANDIP